MSAARRRRIWEAAAGRCGICREPVALDACHIEHPIQLWLGGSDADARLVPVHPACHAPKTKADAKQRAKVRGCWAMKPGAERAPSRLNGRGFRRDVRRKFDGTVEKRR